MNPLTFTWYPSKSQRRQSEFWRNFWSWSGLLGAALLLFCTNLGSFPLLEPEQIFSQVARELVQTSNISGLWLLPIFPYDTDPHQPPLGLFLMAIAAHWGGDHFWLIRLPGAILAALSVPLLYGVAREIFVSWLPAFLSALIYLTLFPVVCWGRLALLDGMILFWVILAVLCGLRSRRNLRWSLGVGLSLSGLWLTHSLMGLLFSGLLLIFWQWDTPRLLRCLYFSCGIFLGCLPALGWYWLQWLTAGQPFLEDLFVQSWQTDWKNYWILLGFYPVELLKYSWPWLIFALSGLPFLWRSMSWGWAKLILVWGGIYFGLICLLPLGNMNYLLPVYPPLALISGKVLTEVYHWPQIRPYPQVWTLILGSLSGLLMLMALSIFLNFPLDFRVFPYRLWLIFASILLGSTFGVTSILIRRRNPQFIAVLIWGMYVCLALFVNIPRFI